MTILLVEHEVTARLVLRQAFEMRGHTVVLATDTAQALRILAVRPITLTVVNVGMPELEGLALLRALKADHPGLRVIALCSGSAASRRNALPTAHALGADAVLTVPFATEDLVATAAHLLRGNVADRSPALQAPALQA